MGVLGGIGPQATMDFVARVHAISQQLIPAQFNSGYPPMTVIYLRHPPFLMEGDRPAAPIKMHPGLEEAAKGLGQLADFLVITANGPHVFCKEVEAASGLSVLSMIDVTLEEVARRTWRKIGLLGLGEPTVYIEPLDELGIACETIDEALQERLDQAIFSLMAGQNDAASTAAAQDAIANLRGKDIDGIVLGCTEIPLLLGRYPEARDLINPAQLLAEAAVRFSMA